MSKAAGSRALPADTMAAIRRVFFEECEEHLDELEEGLSALQRGEADPETIDTIFRAAHSIKGGAGIFDMKAVIRLSHQFESVLDVGRADPARLTPDVVKRLLKATDGLADVIRAARDGAEIPPGVAEALERDVGDLLGLQGVEDEDDDGLDFQPVPMDFAALGDEGRPRTFNIRFRPSARVYETANEPLVLLRELQRLGQTAIALDDADVPTLDKLIAQDSYLCWTVTLDTEADEATVREVFDFVEDDCDLTIGSPDAPPTTEAHDLLPAVAPEADVQPARDRAAEAAAPTIRVDLDRVDRLVDLVSELVINQAMLVQQISSEPLHARSGVPAVLDDLAQLTRDIQDSVIAIRAQPVRAVFQRMARLVREVEAATGKPARLVTEGEATEVDRTVIERLSDPLTHMIRNAIDHGLESPQARLAAGKPAEGVISLTAAHRGGRVILEVSDDGGGIDRERVRAIAVRRGIVAEDASLTPEELDNLIFAPGFSTAETVSDLSGRGVGMDVVRRSVQALGGRISVTSRAGEGSTFTLSLPLTLAVLDGMLVSVRGQSVVVPLTALVESFQVGPEQMRRIGVEATLVTLRGAHVPLIDLGEALGYAGAPGPEDRAVALLVENETGQRAALLVDGIQDQRQVVIKSLEANFRQIAGVAAATILGDGRVALILDIDAILSAERRASAQRPKAA
ncbi:MAG: CheA signal transduction histidine kinase [Phenylobacterium sp.]|nr:CheA signal transduction histidine kinase [Phenylobacterium sp.]